MGDWRPTRTPQERVERAVRSMVPGSLQGKVAQASPVPHRKRGKSPIPPEAVEDLAAGMILFHQDAFVVTDLDNLTFDLTFEPIEHSEHLYWEGVYQPKTEWSRAGLVVSLTDADDLLAVNDEILVEYAHHPAAPAADLIDSVYSSNVDNPVWVPEAAQPGHLLILYMMASSGTTVSALNGWSVVAETEYVTGSAGHVYRMLVLAGQVVAGVETQVPEFTASNNDTPWVMGAYDASGVAAAVERTAQSTGTATSPAPAVTSGMAVLRIFGSVANDSNGVITPAGGTIVASDNDNVQINIVAVAGVRDGELAASCVDTNAGWCMATLTISG